MKGQKRIEIHLCLPHSTDLENSLALGGTASPPRLLTIYVIAPLSDRPADCRNLLQVMLLPV